MPSQTTADIAMTRNLLTPILSTICLLINIFAQTCSRGCKGHYVIGKYQFTPRGPGAHEGARFPNVMIPHVKKGKQVAVPPLKQNISKFPGSLHHFLFQDRTRTYVYKKVFISCFV